MVKEESTPLPLDHALSPLVLLRRLDAQDGMLKELLSASAAAKAEKRDERFVMLEHEFKVIKRIAWLMLAAFVVVAANSLASHFSFRLTSGTAVDPTAAQYLYRMDHPDAGR